MATSFLSDFTDRREVKTTLFGRVYAAKSADGRNVVIKEEIRLTRKSKEKKMSSEPEIHAQLNNHKNIVHYFQTHEEKTHRFIVMEYCPHGSLKDHVEQNGHLSLQEAQFVFKQLVDVLEHIHNKGLLYRNLEPDHVLISHINEENEIFIKLCDFGASRPLKPEGFMRPSEDFNGLAKVIFYSITGCNFVNSSDVYDKLAVFSVPAADLIRKLMSNDQSFNFEAIKSHEFYGANFANNVNFRKEDLDSSFRAIETDDKSDGSVSAHADEMEWTDYENHAPDADGEQIQLIAEFPPRRSEFLVANPPVHLTPQARPLPISLPSLGPGGDCANCNFGSPQSTEAQAEGEFLPDSRPTSSMGACSSSNPAHSAIEINESEYRMSPCDTVQTHHLSGPGPARREAKKQFFLISWILGFFRWFFRC